MASGWRMLPMTAAMVAAMARSSFAMRVTTAPARLSPHSFRSATSLHSKAHFAACAHACEASVHVQSQSQQRPVLTAQRVRYRSRSFSRAWPLRLCTGQPAAEWLSDDGGVRKTVLKDGPDESDTPAWGALVQIQFTCSYDNGTVFDETHRKEPFEFQLNAGTVVEGLQLAVESMAVGERAIVRCEPKWAYGELGAGEVVPKQTTIKYDIELLSWRDGPEAESDDLDLETYKSSLQGKQVAQGSTADYSWTEGGEELTLTMELRDNQLSKDISVEFKASTLRIDAGGDTSPVQGKLRAKVRPDDCYWIIDTDGDVPLLQVTLAKKGVFQRWNGVLRDE